MKKLIVSICLVLLTTLSFGQANKKQLKSSVETYMKYSKALDSDNIIEQLNPKLFNVVPKEDLKASMDMVLNVPGMDISIDDLSVLSISDIKTINKKKFAIIDYSAVTTMKLTNDEMKASANQMLAAFQQQFGESNVSFNQENNSFAVKAKKQMVAEFVKDKWTFVDYDKASPQLMELVFDEKTRQELFK